MSIYFLWSGYTSLFKQLSLPFSVDYAYLYILYTSYYKQLLSSVVCKLWVSILFCDQVIVYDHSTTATEKCLWTHPFENRTKLSPFVSRGSNLYRAPQGKIECDNCVTWVSWPSLFGQNRIYTIVGFFCFCQYLHIGNGCSFIWRGCVLSINKREGSHLTSYYTAFTVTWFMHHAIYTSTNKTLLKALWR